MSSLHGFLFPFQQQKTARQVLRRKAALFSIPCHGERSKFKFVLETYLPHVWRLRKISDIFECCYPRPHYSPMNVSTYLSDKHSPSEDIYGILHCTGPVESNLQTGAGTSNVPIARLCSQSRPRFEGYSTVRDYPQLHCPGTVHVFDIIPSN